MDQGGGQKHKPTNKYTRRHVGRVGEIDRQIGTQTYTDRQTDIQDGGCRGGICSWQERGKGELFFVVLEKKEKESELRPSVDFCCVWTKILESGRRRLFEAAGAVVSFGRSLPMSLS